MTPRITVYNRLSVLAGGRVYPDAAPLNVATPYIVFQFIGGNRGMVLAGLSGEVAQSVQIDCWSPDPDEADSIAEQIIELMCAEGDDDLTVIAVNDMPDDYDGETKRHTSRKEFSLLF